MTTIHKKNPNHTHNQNHHRNHNQNQNHNRNHHNQHSNHNHNHRPIHNRVNTNQQVVVIAIPPTTSTTIVFPSSADGRMFDSGFYSPGLTDGRASFEEINQFLVEINAVRVAAGSQTAAGMCCRSLCFFFAIILFALSMVFVPGLVPVAVICFFVLVVSLMVIMVKRIKRANTEFKAKCQAIVNQHNENFASRGLRWHLPVYFPRWVELWKDYSQNQGVIGQPIYLPPVNQQPDVPAAQSYGVPNQNVDQFQQNNYYQNYQQQEQTDNKNVYTPPSQF